MYSYIKSTSHKQDIPRSERIYIKVHSSNPFSFWLNRSVLQSHQIFLFFILLGTSQCLLMESGGYVHILSRTWDLTMQIDLIEGVVVKDISLKL